MSADMFGMVEIIGYAVAVVLAAACVAYFFLHHVRDVRNELTGETARAAIEQMRTDGVSRYAAGAMASAGEGVGSVSSGTSGSLRVRFFGGDKSTTRPTTAQAPTASASPTSDAAPSEVETTLLTDAATPSEAGTTLLTDAATPSEAGTTLLADDSTKRMPSEAQTTLLGGDATDD